MKFKEYKCKNCKETWGYYPQKGIKNKTICPFCEVNKFQLIRLLYSEGGMKTVIKDFWKHI